jgi:O-glycosyl hydrolase
LLTWDGYDSVYQHAIQNGLGSQPGNDAGNAPAMIAYNSTTHTYTPRQSMYQFGQLFKYVTAGMQLIDTTSSKPAIEAFAFVNTSDGRFTIFGRNTSSSTQVLGGTLANVPAVGPLHYIQTNGSSNMAKGADVPVSGGSFTVSIPANTVFTLTTL